MAFRSSAAPTPCLRCPFAGGCPATAAQAYRGRRAHERALFSADREAACPPRAPPFSPVFPSRHVTEAQVLSSAPVLLDQCAWAFQSCLLNHPAWPGLTPQRPLSELSQTLPRESLSLVTGGGGVGGEKKGLWKSPTFKHSLKKRAWEGVVEEHRRVLSWVLKVRGTGPSPADLRPEENFWSFWCVGCFMGTSLSIDRRWL